MIFLFPTLNLILLVILAHHPRAVKYTHPVLIWSCFLVLLNVSNVRGNKLVKLPLGILDALNRLKKL